MRTGAVTWRAVSQGPGLHRVRVWLGVWAGWTALALVFASSTWLTYRSTGRPANWSLTVSRALAEWWLWALLTPLVFALARRYPLHGARRWRHAAVHAAAGLVLAVAKTAADRAVVALLSGFWMYWLASTLALQYVVYAAIVAAAHGVAYYRRSRERDHLEARLAATRLQLLTMQLQPHFLFNTLNTIAELVHEDPEAADRMIGGLSDLLRRTLELRDVQEITLAAELELLALYLELQRARFGERLQASFSIDETVRVARVPMLLLQPLVENAIRHGLAAHRSAGRIDVEARRIGDQLEIQVTDDGRGASDEPKRGREGVGLHNIQARLEALYPGAASLELANAPDRGARATVRIPFHTGG